jgi:tetratricopeptide (TPR) repeat protein
MVRFNLSALCPLAVIALLSAFLVQGQSVPPSTAMAALHGIVRDSANHPIPGATVRLQIKGEQILTVRTDSAGAYLFSDVREGTYILRAEMAGYDPASSDPFVLAAKDSKTIDLILNASKAATTTNPPRSQPAFFDEPHFTVAGVTDTTNLGGHGSDVVARNQAALAQGAAALSEQLDAASTPHSSSPATEESLREAAARQPEEFDANYRLGKILVDESKMQEALPYLDRASKLNPSNFENAFELARAYEGTGNYVQARTGAQTLLVAADRSLPEKAELHHLLGDVDEKLGDSLQAVREYQSAAELDATEANLFAWGAELLTHHADEPAIEVFTKGAHLFPRSVRMLTGLGAAWYSLGSYEKAAQSFCEASDLNPNDPNPYLFMGKMQTLETAQSDEVLQHLARFVQLAPQNALANYYYAVSLRKQRTSLDGSGDEEKVKSLLKTAIRLDPTLGLAYLELGIIDSQQKDIPKAISDLQQAIAVTPQLEQAHYRLAQLYRRVGEMPKAKAELQLYEQISMEKTQETERQRHELQQFVYQMRDQTPASQTP